MFAICKRAMVARRMGFAGTTGLIESVCAEALGDSA
jgi:hypothetical protein